MLKNIAINRKQMHGPIFRIAVFQGKKLAEKAIALFAFLEGCTAIRTCKFGSLAGYRWR